MTKISEDKGAAVSRGRFWFYLPEDCPSGPHRGPQGPNEDVAQCHGCGSISHALRPVGQTFGDHATDCALPERHEGFCVPAESGGTA